MVIVFKESRDIDILMKSWDIWYENNGIEAPFIAYNLRGELDSFNVEIARDVRELSFPTLKELEASATKDRLTTNVFKYLNSFDTSITTATRRFFNSTAVEKRIGGQRARWLVTLLTSDLVLIERSIVKNSLPQIGVEVSFVEIENIANTIIEDLNKLEATLEASLEIIEENCNQFKRDWENWITARKDLKVIYSKTQTYPTIFRAEKPSNKFRVSCEIIFNELTGEAVHYILRSIKGYQNTWSRDGKILDRNKIFETLDSIIEKKGDY